MIDQSGQVFGPEIVTHVSHNLWYTWAKLAIGHARDARAARAEGLLSGDPQAYVPEFMSALQAVTQVVFALDGWYGATYPTFHTGTERPRGAMTADALNGSLEQAMGGRALDATTLRADVEALIGARGRALHHHPRSTVGSSVPLAAGRVPDEYAQYSMEAADRAMKTLRAVLEGCLSSTRPALQPWMEKNRGIVQEVLDLMDRELP